MQTPQKRTRHVASLEGETSPEDVSPIESPAPFKRFVLSLNNVDSFIDLAYNSGESARFTMWCNPSLREKKFVVFRAFVDNHPYVHPVRLFRVDDSIYIQRANVTPIHQSILQYMYTKPLAYAEFFGPFAGLRFDLLAERAASAPTITSPTDYSVISRHRAHNESPNIVGETQYGTHLGGDLGCHQRMNRFFENAAILSGIVVKIRHPWNFHDHNQNSVVLLYYERPPVVPPVPGVPVGEAGIPAAPAPAPAPAPGPAPVVPGEPSRARPSFGIILGRQLTAVEINNLVNTTRINPDFLYGHGRVQRPGGAPPGPDAVPAGRCWFNNPGDDDVYRFHIPARVLMQRADPLDDVIIGGVHVNLNDLPETANMTINCKHLMLYVATGVATMPVPPGGNPIDLVPYGGGQVHAIGPLGGAVVPPGQPFVGHNVGFLANAPGGTALPVAAIAAPEAADE